MTELILKTGPCLIARRWEYDDARGKGAWVDQDVTAHAHQFLFETCEVEPEVTLGDVFRLMEASPLLKAVYHRDFAEELCAEAALGPMDPAEENPADALEYLELYQLWNLNSSNSTFSPLHRLNFHAIGVPQPEDRPDMGMKAGERIHWGITGSSLRKMLHLPVRVNPRVVVCEDDLDAKSYAQEVARYENPGVSLGQFVHGILWELSFHGSPAQTEEFVEGLKAQMEEVKAGTVQTVSGDDLFEQLDRPGAELMLESLGGHTAREVSRALRGLDDDANAADALDAEFEGAVVVKPEYRALTAREFRKMFREAHRAGD